MAKSLRSKWKRKMRAVKRNRNEPRVIKQLKEVLKKDKIHLTEDMIKFKALDLIRKEEVEKAASTSTAPAKVEDSMDVDKEKVIRDKRTMLDADGQYPGWVNPRKAKKLREKRKASKKKGGVRKTPKSKQLAW